MKTQKQSVLAGRIVETMRKNTEKVRKTQPAEVQTEQLKPGRDYQIISFRTYAPMAGADYTRRKRRKRQLT